MTKTTELNFIETACTYKLKKSLETFLVKWSFKTGDLIQWKEGMQNKRGEGPFIVTESLEVPIKLDNVTVEDRGSPYSTEILDIICGEILRDGDGENFITYFYDSRRFEPFKG